MRSILAIILMTFATQASADGVIRAITSDGKEVLLSKQDMTWQYADKMPTKETKLIYSDEFLEIEYLRHENNKLSNNLNVTFELRALKPTTIVKYATHKPYTYDDGSVIYGQIAISDNLIDNFGNSYAVCPLYIKSKTESEKDLFSRPVPETEISQDMSKGIFYGKPKLLKFSTCGPVLDAASFLTGRLNSWIFLKNRQTDFKIFLK